MSIDTIRRSFTKLNIFVYHPLNKLLSSKINIEHRKEIAEEWLCEAETYFGNAIFSDEYKFNLYLSDGNTFIWKESFECLSLEYIIPTVKYEGRSVMTLV